MVNREELDSTGVDIDGIRITNESRTETEVYTRVMGYYRPTRQFNPGKQSEFRDRREFVIDEAAVAGACDAE